MRTAVNYAMDARGADASRLPELALKVIYVLVAIGIGLIVWVVLARFGLLPLPGFL